MEEKKQKKKKRKYRGLRIFGRILLGIFLFIFLVILFIRSPWGQDIIKDYLVSSITDKTGTKVEVDRIFITFSGNLFVDDLYLEDQQGDTLIYSRELEADVPLWPIIQGNGIAINSIEWEGVRANIKRQDTIEGFNFQFLAEAFAPADTTATTTAQDTTAGGMGFRLGDIELRNFDVVYNDAVLGIESRYVVETLDLEMEEMNLEEMTFHASSGFIANSSVQYKQVPFERDPEAEAPPMPKLIIDELELENVKVNYESVPDNLLATMDVQELYLELPGADFEESIFEVNQLDLNNSNIYFRSMASTTAEETPETEPTTSEGFQWPEVRIDAHNISLNNNNITFLNNETEIDPSTFNANAMEIRDLNLHAESIQLLDKQARADINALSFTETGGVNLRELKFNASLNNESMSLEGLVLRLNGNRIEGDLAATYASLDAFMENPENSRINAALPQFNVDLNDLFLVQPTLRENEMMRTLSEKNLHGQLRANGTLGNIQIPSANIRWGQTTRIAATGRIRNVTQPENISFDFPRINVISTRQDVIKFVDEEQLGISLPRDLRLTGTVRGNPQDIEAQTDLVTSYGNISLDGGFSSGNRISFDVDMVVDDLEMDKLMNNEQLGPLNMTLTASGEGNSVNDLDAVLEINISSFRFNNYAIEGLAITGEIEDGDGPITMDYQDENINVGLVSFVQLDSVAPQIDLDMDLEGANLQALGITTRDMRVAFELDASFRGNLESFDLNAEIMEGVAVHQNETYLLGDFEISTRVRPDSTAMDVQNQLLNMSLRSNANPGSFASALQRHYQSYYSEDPYLIDTLDNPVNLQLRAEIREEPILSEVFIPGLEEMDTLDIAIDFNERRRLLTADVQIPFLNYMGNEIDSLQLQANSDRNDFNFNLGFRNLSTGPVDIQRTSLEGSIAENMLYLDFISYHEEEYLMHIQSEIARRNDSLVVHIDPSEVILNKVEWDIPSSNEIILGSNTTEFNDFVLTRSNQRLEIDDNAEDDLDIAFNNFKLASIFGYLNPEEPLASGNMNGNLVIEDPNGNTGFVADVKVDDFAVMDVALGNLFVDAYRVGEEDYDFDMTIRDGNVHLDLTGGFYPTEEGVHYVTELELHEVQMEVVEAFSQEQITDAGGSFSGNINLSGTIANPEYEGELHFDNASFTIATLDAPFTLPSETVEINNQGIYFDNFHVQDKDSNSLTVEGAILTDDLLNPGFNLGIEAEDFMLLNSTAEDNELYYGTAVADFDGTLTGDLNLPVVDLNVEIKSETDFTYVIPPSQVQIEERDGVVLFVNRENPDAILTQTEEESFTLTGFEFTSDIRINPDATFNIIINEETGDNLQVIGEGDLNFNIYANGRTTLSGIYEMSGGHYEMNLYGLVNRRFEIVEGSSISWAGDMFDANLDVTARYEVEASASSLMAAQISGTDTSVRQRYRQEFPFYVFLNVDGELMSPILTFELGMPEDEQGAIGGQVYGRLQQLNQQEQELNKHVFSLLVLNRFYPEAGADGSEGGAMAIARDNLNNALSDQLNVLSNNLLGNSGIELDFGLNTFTDYQGDTPQERTQLDIAAQRNFLDERLIVRVGSEVDVQGSNQVPGEETTPLLGNVSIEYLLTENGRFRIRGFRRNEFENVIEGQVIVSGLALIFNREFNKFRELWGKVEEEESDRNNQKE